MASEVLINVEIRASESQSSSHSFPQRESYSEFQIRNLSQFIIVYACLKKLKNDQCLKIEQTKEQINFLTKPIKVYYPHRNQEINDWLILKGKLAECGIKVRTNVEKQVPRQQSLENQQINLESLEDTIISQYFFSSSGWSLFEIIKYSQQIKDQIYCWLKQTFYTAIELNPNLYLIKAEIQQDKQKGIECKQIRKLQPKLYINVSSTLMKIRPQQLRNNKSLSDHQKKMLSQQFLKYLQLILSFNINIQPFIRVKRKAQIFFCLSSERTDDLMNFIQQYYTTYMPDCIQWDYQMEDKIKLGESFDIDGLNAIFQKECNRKMAYYKVRSNIYYWDEQIDSKDHTNISQQKFCSVIQRFEYMLRNDYPIQQTEALVQILCQQLQDNVLKNIEIDQFKRSLMEKCINYNNFYVIRKKSPKMDYILQKIQKKYRFKNLETNYSVTFGKIQVQFNRKGGFKMNQNGKFQFQQNQFIISLQLRDQDLQFNPLRLVTLQLSMLQYKDTFHMLTSNKRRLLSTQHDLSYFTRPTFEIDKVIFKYKVSQQPLFIISSPDKLRQSTKDIINFICQMQNQRRRGVILIDKIQSFGCIQLKGSIFNQNQKAVHRQQLKKIFLPFEQYLRFYFDGDTGLRNSNNIEVNYVPLYENQHDTGKVILRIIINPKNYNISFKWKEISENDGINIIPKMQDNIEYQKKWLFRP